MSGVSCRSLTAAYNGTTVLNGVDLSVQTGEWLVVVGPNGAGKTTSFYMIAGLASASRGDVKLDGQSITKLPILRKR